MTKIEKLREVVDIFYNEVMEDEGSEDHDDICKRASTITQIVSFLKEPFKSKELQKEIFKENFLKNINKFLEDLKKIGVKKIIYIEGNSKNLKHLYRPIEIKSMDDFFYLNDDENFNFQYIFEVCFSNKQNPLGSGKERYCLVFSADSWSNDRIRFYADYLIETKTVRPSGGGVFDS